MAPSIRVQRLANERETNSLLLEPNVVPEAVLHQCSVGLRFNFREMRQRRWSAVPR
jgi:hypothetical protein